MDSEIVETRDQRPDNIISAGLRISSVDYDAAHSPTVKVSPTLAGAFFSHAWMRILFGRDFLFGDEREAKEYAERDY